MGRGSLYSIGTVWLTSGATVFKLFTFVILHVFKISATEEFRKECVRSKKGKLAFWHIRTFKPHSMSWPDHPMSHFVFETERMRSMKNGKRHTLMQFHRVP